MTTIKLDDVSRYQPGGPHFIIHNTGPEPMVVVDSLNRPVGTVLPGNQVGFFVRPDEAGNLWPVLF